MIQAAQIKIQLYILLSIYEDYLIDFLIIDDFHQPK